MLALEFPPINELIRWRDIVPGLNKVGIIAILAALIGIVVFLAAGRKDPLKAPTGVRNIAESSVDVHRERHRHADDGQGRAAVDAVPAVAVHLRLPVQPARHHPAVPDAGDGPHGDPAVPRPDRVGHLQRRRLQAQRHQVHHLDGMAEGCAGGDATVGRRHRTALQHRASALLPGRPTFRQHARRSHVVDHVRLLDQRLVLRRDEADLPAPRWRSCRSSCCCS